MNSPASLRALGIAEVLQRILRIARDTSLPEHFILLTGVSKWFRENVFYVFWHYQPVGDVFRPLLALTGDYSLKPTEAAKLRDGVQIASPQNWSRFSRISSHLRTLKLNLSTVRSLSVLESVEKTITALPARISLPQLEGLHLVMDGIQVHFDLALCFLRSSTRLSALSVLLFPPDRQWHLRSETPRFTEHPLTPLETYLMPEINGSEPIHSDDRSILDTCIRVMCSTVVECCPNLSRLRFVLSDADAAFDYYEILVEMVLALPKVQSLTVARNTAVASILCMLSGHPSLRTFDAFQARFPPCARTYAETLNQVRWGEGVANVEFWSLWNKEPVGTSPYNTLQPAVCANLRALCLEIDPGPFQEVMTDWVEVDVAFMSVEDLRLTCSTLLSGIEFSEREVHTILAGIPRVFPALKHLRAGPLRWNPDGYEHDREDLEFPDEGRRFRVTASVLDLLTPCENLESLTLEAAYHAHVSAAEWDSLLPHWPQLRLLLLLSTQPLRVGWPDAPLNEVLAAFRAHCPRIEFLAVPVIFPTDTVFPGPGEWPASFRRHNFYGAFPAGYETSEDYRTLNSGRLRVVATFAHDERPDLDGEDIYLSRETDWAQHLRQAIVGMQAFYDSERIPWAPPYEWGVDDRFDINSESSTALV